MHDVFVDMDEIIPGLWLGSDSTEYKEAKKILDKNNVKQIIQLREKEGFNPYPHSGIKYFNICIEDDESENIYPYFLPCILMIQKTLFSSESILIHCHAGISRSASIVIAFLLYTTRRNDCPAVNTVKHAIEKIQSAGRTVEPNSAFLSQLESFSTLCQTLAYLPLSLDCVSHIIMEYLF